MLVPIRSAIMARTPLCGNCPPKHGLTSGDLHCNAPNVQETWEQGGQILVTTQCGPYPHTGDGVEVRRSIS